MSVDIFLEHINSAIVDSGASQIGMNPGQIDTVCSDIRNAYYIRVPSLQRLPESPFYRKFKELDRAASLMVCVLAVKLAIVQLRESDDDDERNALERFENRRRAGEDPLSLRVFKILASSRNVIIEVADDETLGSVMRKLALSARLVALHILKLPGEGMVFHKIDNPFMPGNLVVNIIQSIERCAEYCPKKDSEKEKERIREFLEEDGRLNVGKFYRCLGLPEPVIRHALI